MPEHVWLGEPDAVDAYPPAVHYHGLARQADDALHDAAAELDGLEHDDVTPANAFRPAKPPREQEASRPEGRHHRPGLDPGQPYEVADGHRGRHSRGERREQTGTGEVDHGSVLVAVAGEDGGARVMPMRGVAVLVLLALGVLDEAHVGRDPAPTGLDVPDVVNLQ